MDERQRRKIAGILFLTAGGLWLVATAGGALFLNIAQPIKTVGSHGMVPESLHNSLFTALLAYLAIFGVFTCVIGALLVRQNRFAAYVGLLFASWLLWRSAGWFASGVTLAAVGLVVAIAIVGLLLPAVDWFIKEPRKQQLARFAIPLAAAALTFALSPRPQSDPARDTRALENRSVETLAIQATGRIGSPIEQPEGVELKRRGSARELASLIHKCPSRFAAMDIQGSTLRLCDGGRMRNLFGLLGYLGGSDAISELRFWTTRVDADNELRAYAARGLGLAHDRDSGGAIAALLDVPFARDRARAEGALLDALQFLPAPAQAGVLARTLETRGAGWAYAHRALEVLASFDTDEARELTMGFTKSSNVELRKLALELPTKTVGAVALAQLDDDDPAVRGAACRGLLGDNVASKYPLLARGAGEPPQPCRNLEGRGSMTWIEAVRNAVENKPLPAELSPEPPRGGGGLPGFTPGAIPGMPQNWKYPPGHPMNAAPAPPKAEDFPASCGTTVIPVKTLFDNFAIDATHAYWTDPLAGVVLRAPKKGGAIQQLAKGQETPGALAVDGAHVYFVNQRNGILPPRLMRVPKTGGATQTIAENIGRGIRFALDEKNIYIATQGSSGLDNGTVHRVRKAGGGAMQLAGKQFDPFAIAVFAGNVYWGDQQGRVQKITVDGGDVTVVAEGQMFVSAFAFIDGSLYWTDSDTRRLMRATADRRHPETVLRGRSGATGLSSVGSTLFWVEGRHDVRIGEPNKRSYVTFAIGATEPTVIGTDDFGGTSLFADSESVFWMSRRGVVACAR